MTIGGIKVGDLVMFRGEEWKVVFAVGYWVNLKPRWGNRDKGKWMVNECVVETFKEQP